MPFQLVAGQFGDWLIDGAEDTRQRLNDLHLDARAD